MIKLINDKYEIYGEIHKMNISKTNKAFNLILLLFVVYSLLTFYNQQKKINLYSKDIAYYSSQIDELNSKKEELLAVQENVNSPEYIEEVAREKLDMYLPNERVYIDVSK